MVYSCRACRAALEKKGFIRERRTKDDVYYYHHSGKKTSVFTKLSQGRQEDLRDPILAKIRIQLRLETNGQLRDFIECPMTREGYADYLLEKALITTD